MIRSTNVVRSFGATGAPGDLSPEVRSREIFGLFGPDGTGKQTLVSIGAGLP